MELVSTRPARWNHNLHNHRVILAAVPDGARRSLDVGCGEGMLARDMRRVVAHVTGIDRDAASTDVARRVLPGARSRRLLLWRFRWCGGSRRELASARRLGAARRLHTHRGKEDGGGRGACRSACGTAPGRRAAGFLRGSSVFCNTFRRATRSNVGLPPSGGVGPTFEVGVSKGCCETRAIAPPRRTRRRTTARAANHPHSLPSAAESLRTSSAFRNTLRRAARPNVGLPPSGRGTTDVRRPRLQKVLRNTRDCTANSHTPEDDDARAGPPQLRSPR
jgi:methyltransferase family protein